MANSKTIEIELDTPIIKKLEFIRLSARSTVYFDSWRQKTYICKDCGGVVVGTTTHAMWHQKQLQLMIDIAHKVIPLEEANAIRYQPTVINQLKKPEF